MRLLTRSDFDGLACGALLKELGVVDCWKFVHPKDIQDGFVDVRPDDCLANIPYAPGCGLWFDHHASEEERLAGEGLTQEHGAAAPRYAAPEAGKIAGAYRNAPSCARVVYDYFDGKERLPGFASMVAAVDKVDSGNLTRDEIVDPSGWVLLGFVMDPRTGLGRFGHFTVSNYTLMEKLIDACRMLPIDEILTLPDVVERVRLYHEQNELFKDMVLRHSILDRDTLITDLRGVRPIYAGNRFLPYCLFPDANISVWLVDGRGGMNCAFAVGHSILNRTSLMDVGKLCLAYGGGGHRKVGTCQAPVDQADRVLRELREAIAALRLPDAETEDADSMSGEFGNTPNTTQEAISSPQVLRPSDAGDIARRPAHAPKPSLPV